MSFSKIAQKNPKSIKPKAIPGGLQKKLAELYENKLIGMNDGKKIDKLREDYAKERDEVIEKLAKHYILKEIKILKECNDKTLKTS